MCRLHQVFAVGVLAAAASLAACGGGSGERAITSDAALVSLQVSAGRLEPAFSPDTAVYAIGPERLPDAITVLPVTSDVGATVTVNGLPVASGTDSPPLALTMGVQTILIVLTASDETTTRTYLVEVDRTSSTLVSLQTSVGTLTPTFDPETSAYGVEIELELSRIQLTPTLSDPMAALKVNDEPVASSTPSSEIMLPFGLTPIDVTITARDGAVQTYVVLCERRLPEEEAYIKASNAEAYEFFGLKVSISGDTLLVGADYEDGDGSGEGDNSAMNAGAAYVFTRTGAAWTQQAYLKASNVEADDLFGSSVSVSGDTLVVGASFEDGDGSGEGDNSATNAGAAYVFTRSGTTWTQQAYLKASNAQAFDRFGFSVSLDADTLVVGAVCEDGNGSGEENELAPDAGAAYVFTRTGTTWTQRAYLKASNPEVEDYFGFSAAVSGGTVVVGALGEDGDGTHHTDNSAPEAGAVYVFTSVGDTWAQQAYLKASNAEAGDEFGNSVSISGDTAVVGAPREAGDGSAESDNSATRAGAVYVFTRTGTTWTQQAYLKASNAYEVDHFGSGSSVSGDALVIGAMHEDGGGQGEDDDSALNAGAAYLFTRTGTTWTQQAYLKASNVEAEDRLGVSVSISGGTLVVGAYQESGDGTADDDNSATHAGAAYVYR